MNLTHRLRLWTVRLALVAGFAGPCLPVLAAAQTTSITLQLVGQTDTSIAGAIVASKAGLFAQQGLTVKIEHLDNGGASFEDGSAVVIRLQNARDFLLARAGGAPLVVIAGNEVD